MSKSSEAADAEGASSSSKEEMDWKMESENIMKTDLKSNICIAEMTLDQDKQLANDYVLLTKALHSRLGSCSTSTLLGETLRSSEAYAAVSARDDCNFSVKSFYN